MEYDVIVLGAGMAGMFAARELARGGCSVALVEARDRVGGRVRAAVDPRALAPVELGGEFVHGRPAVTYELLREIGATVVDNAQSHADFRGDALPSASDAGREEVGKILATALERERDESVDALVARGSNRAPAPATAQWVRRLVTGFDAADPARASARAIAQEWAGDASADGAQSRPIGGYAPLVAHLARSLDPARVDLQRETVATHIAWDARGVRVAARAHGRDRFFHARRAVVCVPHGVLTAEPGAEGAIAFEPPLPATTRAALTSIATGPVIKIVLCFRSAVWETLRGGAWRDVAFFTGDGPFPTFWTQLPVRANTLVAWAGGPDADRLAQHADAARIDLALECAGRYFGDVVSMRTAFAGAHVHDWQRDPFARGAYSYLLVGGERAREALAAPVDGALWFAGEATAAGGEGGTVAGALLSGRRAAHQILAER